MQDSDDAVSIFLTVLRVMLFTSLEMKTRLQLMSQNTWPRSLQVYFTHLRHHCEHLMQPSHCVRKCIAQQPL